MADSVFDVVVVGAAGAMGSSAAMHIARRGRNADLRASGACNVNTALRDFAVFRAGRGEQNQG